MKPITQNHHPIKSRILWLNTASITTQLSHALLVMAIMLLALDPVRWLVNTWQDAAYDSAGFWVFLITIGCFVYAYSSPFKPSVHTSQQKLQHSALVLLALTALARLLSQLWAINTLGALALVIDVYALALLAGLPYRQRALSPAWLAVLFAFSLPIERIIQRVVGFALQEVSATSSCQLLSLMSDSVICSGTRISVKGSLFLIDLPCSGSNSLVLLAIMMTALMVWARPSIKQGFMAVALVLMLALIANTARILLLVGGASSSSLQSLGINTLEQPWHDLCGLLVLIPCALVVYQFYLYVAIAPKHSQQSINQPMTSGLLGLFSKQPQTSRPLSNKLKLLLSCAFIALSLVIINLPAKPLDSKRDNSALTQNAPRLPIMLGNHYAQTIPLLAKEQTYFTQYGGFAHKAVYGERQVLLSGTQSPLRHLHAPDECLRGLGFKVSYLGSMDSPIPSAIYKAVSPDGNVWRVAVSFIASSGMTTTNVSAAVWQWLQKPNTTWYALQRISPWSSSNIQADRQWDKSLLNALDLLPVAAASNNLNNTSLNSITNPTQS